MTPTTIPTQTMMTKPSPKAFLYGRHSTRKQDMSQKVQYQKCLEFYESGLKPDGYELGGWWYDEAVSAARVGFGERPKGRIVLASLRPGDALVIAKMDRAFRSVMDGSKIIEQLAMRQVTVHSLDLAGIDGRSSFGRAFQQFMLIMAELERNMIRDRTIESVEWRRSQKIPVSRHAPPGWKIVKQGRRGILLEIDIVERRLIDRFAILHAHGWGYCQIGRWAAMQDEYPNKRHLSDNESVRYALMCRSLGYPKVTEGFKKLRRLVREGVIRQPSAAQSPPKPDA